MPFEASAMVSTMGTPALVRPHARKSPSSQNNPRRFNIDRQDVQDEIPILSILCIDVKL